MASWILVLIPLYGVLRAEGSKLTSVECCGRGRERGILKGDCVALPIISNNLHCSMVQEKCCKAVIIHKLCDSGITMYREQGSCEKPFFSGRAWSKDKDTSKMCCDCCMLGLEEAKLSSSCDLPGLMLSRQCAHAARTCCRNATNKETDPEHKDPVTEKPAVTTTTRPQGRNQTCGDSICAHLCVGNGTCACNDGYRLQKDGVSCEDINECLNGSHHCPTGRVCINTQGSFRCRREKICGTGYELWDNSCKDINECALGTHNCGPDFVCNNTLGSFRCDPKDKCRGGFMSDTVGSCIDINECITHVNPCPPSQTCSNTAGSYTCSRNTLNCRRGFHLADDGTRCEDIDECRQGDNCVTHGCLNLVGSFRCQCRNGFIFDTINRRCEDMNECLNYPKRMCAHNCENTEGSFRCSCTTGFRLARDERSCEDINECEASPCKQECTNTYGSYSCYCQPGYKKNEKNESLCDDIDECALQTDNHLCAYHCSNTNGSFICTCPPTGYTLAADGRTCQDINECVVKSDNCTDTERCFNIQGGFRCLSFKCPTYYREIGTGRCDRATCEFTQNPSSCFSRPLRISFYNISFPDNTPVPADIFRMGPSNSAMGDVVALRIVSGDMDGYFGVRQHAHGGEVSLRRPLFRPRDFFLTVEMTLTRYGTTHLYMAKIAVFVTHAHSIWPSRIVAFSRPDM
ncbi:fibulin-1-like isoform X2 [Nelusetta ayraudi]|uniref:fibulin-1-like isoform X2 n=1 Tax=Nelusetta ayraudi TaxID=303726 RepID=UPI003F710320